MKRLLLIAASLMAAAVLAACSAVQVSERMFVQLMGIEEDNGMYLLTVQTYSSTGNGSEEPVPGFEVHSGSGRSFYEAADMIMRENGRELFFGHCSAIFADDEMIRSSGKLNMLAGERISVACPVIYADSPSSEAAAKDESGRLISADKILSELELYARDGLYSETVLSEVVSAAKSGGTVIIPAFKNGIYGSAAVNMSGETALLDMTETAALDLMRGEKGIRLSVLGGSASVNSSDKRVYFERTGESGGVYSIEISADCTLDEKGTADDMSLYREELESIISRSAEAICARALSDGFLSAVLPAGYEYSAGAESVDFRVNTAVALGGRHGG